MDLSQQAGPAWHLGSRLWAEIRFTLHSLLGAADGQQLMARATHGGELCQPRGSKEHTGTTKAPSQSFPWALPRHEAEGRVIILLQVTKGRD